MIKGVLIAFIVSFSVTSAVLYVLPIILNMVTKTDDSDSRRRLDIGLKHTIGIMSIITAILSLIYFFI